MSPTVNVAVAVDVPPELAFEVFADELASWWPREYSWSRDVLEDIGIEPHEDGLCFERGPQASAATGDACWSGIRRDG
jgi:hypothetical protein